MSVFNELDERGLAEILARASILTAHIDRMKDAPRDLKSFSLDLKAAVHDFQKRRKARES